jgi:hypothetical protein
VAGDSDVAGGLGLACWPGPAPALVEPVAQPIDGKAVGTAHEVLPAPHRAVSLPSTAGSDPLVGTGGRPAEAILARSARTVLTPPRSVLGWTGFYDFVPA